jgi:hypothetical protein
LSVGRVTPDSLATLPQAGGYKGDMERWEGDPAAVDRRGRR